MKQNKIILATHGDFSKGIKHALCMILGDLAESLETFSLYPGESAADYAAKMEKEIKEDGMNFIFLTDVRGGSVYSALFQLLRYDNVRLLAGTNLPMAIEVVLNPEQVWNKAGVDEVLKSAVDGVSCEDSRANVVQEEEDF